MHRFFLYCVILTVFQHQILASLSWTKTNPKVTAGSIVSIAYGNGVYLVPAYYPNKIEFLISKDFVQWTTVPLPESTIPVGNGFAYVVQFCGNQFIALPTLYTGTSIPPTPILVSEDGLNWETIPTNIYFGTSLECGNGVIVNAGASEGLYSSVDGGKTWNQHSVPGYVSGVEFFNGNFYVYGYSSGLVLVSSDGTNWKTWNLTGIFGENSVPLYQIYALLQDSDGTFIMAAQQCVSANPGCYTDTASTHIVVSKDSGTTWKIVSDLPNDFLFGYLTYGNGIYNLIGYLQDTSGFWYWSSTDDAQTWNNVTYSSIDVIPQYLGNQWVGFNPISQHTILQYSTDDDSWGTVDCGLVDTLYNVFLNQNEFILSTDAGIYTSDDGVNWLMVYDSPIEFLQYVEDIYSYIGISGDNLVISLDLEHWNSIQLPKSQRQSPRWTSLIYANGMFVVSATIVDVFKVYGAIFYYDSTNPSGTWQRSEISNLSEFDSGVDSLAYADNVFVASSTEGLLVSFDNAQTFTIGQQFAEYSGCTLKTFPLAPQNTPPFYYVCSYGSLLSATNVSNFQTIPSLPYVTESLSYLQTSGVFVATGIKGDLYISRDGYNFESYGNINNLTPFDWVVENSNNLVIALSASDNSIYTTIWSK